MIPLRRYLSISVLLAGAVVYHAFTTRRHFFPAALYLSTSKLAVAAVGNLSFAMALCAYNILVKVFLGHLREIELERVKEKLSSAVMETCLALTIFREEFNGGFVAMFTALTFIKVFHWLVQDRVDFVEVTPAVSRLQHARIVAFMMLLWAIDVAFLQHTVAATLASGGHSVQLLFAFEYVILASSVGTTFMKYCLSRADGLLEGRWEGKGVAVFYLELMTDMLHLLVYCVFFVIVFTHYGLPLHLIRDLYITFRNFRNRIGDFLRFRQVTARMDRFPNATAEDLARCDGICIICREEMHAAGPNKKLLCGHVFHLHCLRSWLERQQNCPTCRNSVFRQAMAVAPQPGQAAAQGAAAPAAAQGVEPAAVAPGVAVAPGAAGGAVVPAEAAGARGVAQPPMPQHQQQPQFRMGPFGQQHLHHGVGLGGLVPPPQQPPAPSAAGSSRAHHHQQQQQQQHQQQRERHLAAQHEAAQMAAAAAAANHHHMAAAAGPGAAAAPAGAAPGATAAGQLPPGYWPGSVQAPAGALMLQMPPQWYPVTSMAAFTNAPLQYAGQQTASQSHQSLMEQPPAGAIAGMVPLLPMIPAALSAPFPTLPFQPFAPNASPEQQHQAAAAAAAMAAAAAAMYSPMAGLVMMPPAMVAPQPMAGNGSSSGAGAMQAEAVAAAAANAAAAAAAAMMAGGGNAANADAVHGAMEATHAMLQRQLEYVQGQMQRMQRDRAAGANGQGASSSAGAPSFGAAAAPGAEPRQNAARQDAGASGSGEQRAGDAAGASSSAGALPQQQQERQQQQEQQGGGDDAVASAGDGEGSGDAASELRRRRLARFESGGGSSSSGGQ